MIFFFLCIIIGLASFLHTSLRRLKRYKQRTVYSSRALGVQTCKRLRMFRGFTHPAEGVEQKSSGRIAFWNSCEWASPEWRTTVRLTPLFISHDVIQNVFKTHTCTYTRDPHVSSAPTCWVWGSIAFINIPVISGKKTSPPSGVKEIRNDFRCLISKWSTLIARYWVNIKKG